MTDVHARRLLSTALPFDIDDTVINITSWLIKNWQTQQHASKAVVH